MLTQQSPIPPPIKKQRATSTPMKYPVQQQYHQPPQTQPQPPQYKVASAPTSSSRRAQLEAMQQRLSNPTVPQQYHQAPHTISNTNNILAMARSQLESKPTMTTASLSSQSIRSSSAGSLQRQQHQYPRPSRPMSSIMVNKDSDDDSLLVTPPDYQLHSVKPMASSSSNGSSYKSSPPPPPTPKELQKYYSKNTPSVTSPSSVSTTSKQPTSSNNTNTLRLIQKLVQVTEEKTAAIQKASMLEKTLFEYQQNNKKVPEQTKVDTSKFIMYGAGLMKLKAIQDQKRYKKINMFFNKWKNHALQNKDVLSTPPPILSVPNTPSPPPQRTFSSSSIKSAQSTPPITTKYIQQALNTVSLDYTSDIATYAIRCPYKPSTQQMTISSIDDYIQKATPFHPNTIELYITIKADKSNYILHSNDSLYNILLKSNEIHPLQNVLYITTMGIEDEYSLQDVYNECLIVRENYCTNLLVAAHALQKSFENQTISTKDLRRYEDDDSSTIATKDTFHNNYFKDNSTAISTSTRDVGIQTDKVQEEIITPKETAFESTSYFGKPTSRIDEIASNFIFTTFYGFIFFLQIVFLYIPKFLFRLTKVMSIGIVIVGFLWWYLANDYGALDRMEYYGGSLFENEGMAAFWEIARNAN